MFSHRFFITIALITLSVSSPAFAEGLWTGIERLSQIIQRDCSLGMPPVGASPAQWMEKLSTFLKSDCVKVQKRLDEVARLMVRLHKETGSPILDEDQQSILHVLAHGYIFFHAGSGTSSAFDAMTELTVPFQYEDLAPLIRHARQSNSAQALIAIDYLTKWAVDKEGFLKKLQNYGFEDNPKSFWDLLRESLFLQAEKFYQSIRKESQRRKTPARKYYPKAIRIYERMRKLTPRGIPPHSFPVAVADWEKTEGKPTAAILEDAQEQIQRLALANSDPGIVEAAVRFLSDWDLARFKPETFEALFQINDKVSAEVKLHMFRHFFREGLKHTSETVVSGSVSKMMDSTTLNSKDVIALNMAAQREDLKPELRHQMMKMAIDTIGKLVSQRMDEQDLKNLHEHIKQCAFFVMSESEQ